MTPLTIRDMQRKDIPSILTIIESSFDKEAALLAEPEFEASFTNTIFKPQYLVATHDNTIIGCGGYMPSSIDYGVYEIFWINVKSEYRGRGVGTQLVGHIVELIRGKGATMILLSATNTKLYAEKFGFKTARVFNGGRSKLMTLCF